MGIRQFIDINILLVLWPPREISELSNFKDIFIFICLPSLNWTFFISWIKGIWIHFLVLIHERSLSICQFWYYVRDIQLHAHIDTKIHEWAHIQKHYTILAQASVSSGEKHFFSFFFSPWASDHSPTEPAGFFLLHFNVSCGWDLEGAQGNCFSEQKPHAEVILTIFFF